MKKEWECKGIKYGVLDYDEKQGEWHVSIWWLPPRHTERHSTILPDCFETEEDAIGAAKNYIEKVV